MVFFLHIVAKVFLIFLYQALFVKKQPPPEPIPETSPEAVAKAEQKPALLPPTQTEPQTQAPQELDEPTKPVEFQPVSSDKEEQIIIDTSLYRGVWSNKGGVLKSWRLKDFKDSEGEDLEIVSARSEEIGIFPFFLRSDDPNFDQVINGALYNSSSYRLELTGGKTGTLRFEYADDSGTRVEKILTFQDGLYG